MLKIGEKALSDTERRIRSLCSTNLTNAIAAFRPLLLDDGVDDDTISRWVQVGCAPFAWRGELAC